MHKNLLTTFPNYFAVKSWDIFANSTKQQKNGWKTALKKKETIILLHLSHLLFCILAGREENVKKK